MKLFISILTFIAVNASAETCGKMLAKSTRAELFSKFIGSKSGEEARWAMNISGRMKTVGEIKFQNDIAAYGYPYQRNGVWVLDFLPTEPQAKKANYLHTLSMSRVETRWGRVLNEEITKRVAAPWVLPTADPTRFVSAVLQKFDGRSARFNTSDGSTIEMPLSEVRRVVLFQRANIAHEGQILSQAGAKFEIILFDSHFTTQAGDVGARDFDNLNGYYIRPLELKPAPKSGMYLVRYDRPVQKIMELLHQGVAVLLAPGDLTGINAAAMVAEPREEATKALNGILMRDSNLPLILARAECDLYTIDHEMVHYRDLQDQLDLKILEELRRFVNRFKLQLTDIEIKALRNTILEQRAYSSIYPLIAQDYAANKTDQTYLDFVHKSPDAPAAQIEMVLSGEFTLATFSFSTGRGFELVASKVMAQSPEAIPTLLEILNKYFIPGPEQLKAENMLSWVKTK